MINGTVHKYGDNIDTDVIIPARYLNQSDPDELAKYCMIDIDKEFASRVNSGDVMVGNLNFGCGSSREHAPIAIKASGISVVIAKSFARIFYRNSFNVGLPLLECEEVEKIESGDQVKIDLTNGIITNITKSEEYKATAIPEFMQSIIASGGLVGRIQNEG